MSATDDGALTADTEPRQQGDDIALAVEDLLRHVPGVTTVYPTAPLPAQLVGGLLAAHTSVSPPRLVTVAEVDGALTVTAQIGVALDCPAQSTGRAAHDLIADYLGSRDPGSRDSARVTVRIGMVG